jgi:uncharacterized protein (DUF433 family)
MSHIPQETILPGNRAIERTEGVCGGAARIAGTRIPIWMLENARRHGSTEAEVLEMYPWLTAMQVRSAWEYATQHSEEMEEAIRDNEDA